MRTINLLMIICLLCIANLIKIKENLRSDVESDMESDVESKETTDHTCTRKNFFGKCL